MPVVTVSIHEAKTKLSELIERAVKGETFVITKAGKPLVKVEAFHAGRTPKRFGFLKGEIAVPKDFNRMSENDIDTLFGAQRLTFPVQKRSSLTSQSRSAQR